MSRNLIDHGEEQSRLTPMNTGGKTIEKTSLSKAIFGTLKTQQHEHHSNTQFETTNKISSSKKSQLSPNQHYSPKNIQLKHSHFIKEDRSNRTNSQIYRNQFKPQQTHNYIQESRLYSRIQFLEHCMNEYKQQALSMYSKLQQRERYYNQTKHKYDSQILSLKQQIQCLQKQIQGQSQLIQQCHQKYDTQVKEGQLCLNLINQQKALIQALTHQVHSLQYTVTSTRQVSVNLIKQNQSLKAQIIIESEKYQLLYQDYGLLSLKYEHQVKEMHQENRLLIRKLDDVEVQLRIHQKDKEIQNLLTYEDSIQKRQRELVSADKMSSSPPSVVYYQNDRVSPYDYKPKRLNFQQDILKSNGNSHQRKEIKGYGQMRQEDNTGHVEIIQLQKSKISHLENQLKQLEKRNKQLQTLMLKFMK